MSMLLAFLLAGIPPSPTLTYETSGNTRTGRLDEVLRWCEVLPKRYPGRVRCDTFGTTPLGRPMVVFAASDDGVLTPEANHSKARPVLFLEGGIHAGEIDGKDAGLMLLRDALDGKLGPKALSKVTLVFVPIFNVDGHERFGPNNRPNQRGPIEMGWRVTSQNLNLNRDWSKADAPEMQAMLTLLNKWDPIFFADLHVTDGAKFQHDVSITFEPQQIGPEGLRVVGKALKVALFSELQTKGHTPVGFYPSFIKDDDPSSGFEYGWPPPRFAQSYWAAHNRFGMLVETHAWKDYKTRVTTTYDVCAGLLRLTASEGASWLHLADAADSADLRRAGADVPLLYKAKQQAKKIEFLGYEYKREPSPISGQPWVDYDESKPQTWTVPYFDELAPALVLKAPDSGYVIPPPHAGWLAEKLKLHGFSYTVLKAPRPDLRVETFRVEPEYKPGSYEGHLTLTVKGGAWKADTIDVPAGSLYVPIRQARSPLLMMLLEPKSPESYLAWGFFNANLEQKEYLEDYMVEAFARELMASDAGVKAEFEAKLKDEAFAKNAKARLDFFYERHPSYDQALRRYPVYRTAAAMEPR